jgi:hypothetical protein
MERTGVLHGIKATKRAKSHRHGHFHKLVGVGIALMGFFWFGNLAGWIPVDEGGSPLFWPVVTVAIGVGIILRAGKRRGTKSEE